MHFFVPGFCTILAQKNHLNGLGLKVSQGHVMVRQKRSETLPGETN